MLPQYLTQKNIRFVNVCNLLLYIPLMVWSYDTFHIAGHISFPFRCAWQFPQLIVVEFFLVVFRLTNTTQQLHGLIYCLWTLRRVRPGRISALGTWWASPSPSITKITSSRMCSHKDTPSMDLSIGLYFVISLYSSFFVAARVSRTKRRCEEIGM